MDFDTEKKLTKCYSPILFDKLKFNEILNDRKFIKRLATNLAKMLFGYLKDIRFYLKFIDECEKRYPSFNIENIRKNCIIVEDFTNAILYISIKDKYNIKTLMEIKNMNFDVAIMNPPYDGNLHLKILEKVIPIADKVINISPVRWLQDPLAKYKPKKDNLQEKYKNILSVLESLTIIPASDANKLFNINWGDLGIYVIDKNCKNPYQIIEHPGVKIVDKIQFNKLCSLCDVMRNEKDIYFCPITHAMRAVNCAHGYTILFTDNGPYAKSGWTKDAGNNYHFINLNSKNEVDNFKKYVTTKSVRFICKLVALGGMGGQNNLIPYMSDYTQPWTDKRFCEYFGITGYIDDDHAEPGSEWETILNTMKEYV